MSPSCTHLDQVADVTPSSDCRGDCLRVGGRWLHLRMCMTGGDAGCCINSSNRHAAADVVDDVAFEVDGAPSVAHP